MNPFLKKLIALLKKDIVLTETVDKNTIELTYEDGERVRLSMLQLDRPASEVLN